MGVRAASVSQLLDVAERNSAQQDDLAPVLGSLRIAVALAGVVGEVDARPKEPPSAGYKVALGDGVRGLFRRAVQEPHLVDAVVQRSVGREIDALRDFWLQVFDYD